MSESSGGSKGGWRSRTSLGGAGASAELGEARVGRRLRPGGRKDHSAADGRGKRPCARRGTESRNAGIKSGRRPGRMPGSTRPRPETAAGGHSAPRIRGPGALPASPGIAGAKAEELERAVRRRALLRTSPKSRGSGSRSVGRRSRKSPPPMIEGETRQIQEGRRFGTGNQGGAGRLPVAGRRWTEPDGSPFHNRWRPWQVKPLPPRSRKCVGVALGKPASGSPNDQVQ